MDEKPNMADRGELSRLGLYDPNAPDAASRLELIRWVRRLGATDQEIAAAPNLGELALDLHLRPRGTLTLEQAVINAGISWRGAQRLLTAIGIPAAPDLPVTSEEAEAVRLLAVASRDLLGEDATVQLARVTANAMARVAETIVGAFRVHVELPRRASGTSEVEFVREYVGAAETMLPAFVRTLDVLLRRQIIAAAERMWSTDDERSAVTVPRTVGFADLVGYTTAVASMSVRQLISVLIEFDELTSEIVARHNGQVVKTVGDEAMFATDEAAEACRIALDLVGAFDRGDLPPVRVGLAAGHVVSVLGDLFGPEVNLAARLVDVAEPSTVVVSDQVRSSAGEVSEFDALPPVALKGFSTPVPVYRVRA